MPHIHNEPGEHDHTVSAFIVRKFEDNVWRLLLHRHKKLGTLMQFGGHIELNETPWQTLAHELREESGYDMNELRIVLSPPKIGLVDTDEHYAPFSMNTHSFNKERTHFHTDATYAFIAHAEPSAGRAEGESKELKWLTYDELIQLPEADIFSNVKQLGLFVLSTVSNTQDNSSNI